MSDGYNVDLPLLGRLAQADGRRRPVRVFRRLRRQLIADSGGAGNVSAARLAVIDTLAQAVALQREEFAAYASDPGHDPSRFTGLSNLVLGSSRSLGLARVPRDVPSLRAIIEQATEAPDEAQEPPKSEVKGSGRADHS